MEYYRHKHPGRIASYFGDIGEPDKISLWRYMWMKVQGYKVTKVPTGSSLVEVMRQALINADIALDSYYADKVLTKYTRGGGFRK